MWEQLAANNPAGLQGLPQQATLAASAYSSGTGLPYNAQGNASACGGSTAFAALFQQQQQEQQQQMQAPQQANLAGGYGNALGYNPGSAAGLEPLQQAGYARLSNMELRQRLAIMNAGGGVVPGAAGGGHAWGPGLGGMQPNQALLLQQQQQQQAPQNGGAASAGESGAGAAGWSWLDAFEERQKALAAEKAAGGCPSEMQ